MYYTERSVASRRNLRFPSLYTLLPSRVLWTVLSLLLCSLFREPRESKNGPVSLFLQFASTLLYTRSNTRRVKRQLSLCSIKREGRREREREREEEKSVRRTSSNSIKREPKNLRTSFRQRKGWEGERKHRASSVFFASVSSRVAHTCFTPPLPPPLLRGEPSYLYP